MFVIQRRGLQIDRIPLIAAGVIMLLATSEVWATVFLTCRPPMRRDTPQPRDGGQRADQGD